MRQISTIFLMLLVTASTLYAARDIRIDPDYDPRIELRLVVTPTTLPRALNRTDPRTVSALLATELLREYEIVDLNRFEQFLMDRRFDLSTAFTLRAESVVRDSAMIDGIVDVEIYMWDQGNGGLPGLGRQAGRLGMRIRMMDPFTGRVYWSVNRVEKVNPSADFLKRATVFFRDVVVDLGKQLDKEREARNEYEMEAGMDGMADSMQPPSLPTGKFASLSRKERGFVPLHSLDKADLALRTRSQRETDKPEIKMEDGTLLPPLFEDGYEDIEAVDDPLGNPRTMQGQLTNTTGDSSSAGPPPLPASLRLDDLPSGTIPETGN